MKAYSKKIFLSAFAALFFIATCFGVVACGGDNLKTLKGDAGIEVVGEFEDGAELKTNKVEITSADASEIFTKLETGSVKITDTSKTIVYDIYVSKDNQKVQPSGKVVVSVPIEANEGGYKVFHIKGDNTVEELEATFTDGVLTFETSGFSYYVIVPTGDVSINPTPNTNPTVAAGSVEEWNSVIAYYASQTNVKVMGRYANDDDPPDTGAQIMIYQFNGTAFSEDGYFENELSSQLYKGKIFYLVKEGDAYSRVEWQDMGGEDNWALIKSDYGAEDSYKWAVANQIYGLLDDYNYSDFTYNETDKTYTKTEGDKSIIIAFTFENDVVSKIEIKEVETGREAKTTITFGNAVVEVPTEDTAD